MMGQPSIRPATQFPPRAAGRYELREQLGAGGAATVYRAFDRGEQRLVALKVLARGASERMAAMFRTEFRTLASLSHPNVVRAYDFGALDDQAFYTMELLSGGDLSRAGPLPWGTACREIAAAATALSVLHARRFLHRDISPRNLWRTEQGVIKLIDFGALLPFGPSQHAVGTPPCVAPEALSGGELDQRTDLYALGAVLYYLLTGQHAFPARSLQELPGYWTEAPRRPSQRLREGADPIPAELDALVEALLSKHPRGRPASAAELVDRLNAVVGGEGRAVRASTPSGVLPEPAFVGRERSQRALGRRLRALARGEGGAVLIEGAAGLGRTRLLHELSLDARLEGLAVLPLDARDHPGTYGLASALIKRVIDVQPELGEREARARAGVLAHFGPRVRERLSVTALSALSALPGESRALLQEKWVELFVSVASQAPLAVLIDDVDAADEASLACLLALAEASREAPILLVTSVQQKHRDGAAVRALRRLSEVIRLKPLSPEETHAQVLSMFGEVPHLTRFVARLAAHARGNPRDNERLARKLAEAGAIGFCDGLWVLPQELDDALFLDSAPDNDGSLLDTLSGELGESARALTVVDGVITAEIGAVLCDTDEAEARRALDALVERGVLARTAEQGYRFVHEELRAQLSAQQTDGACDWAHARYGRLLAERSEEGPLAELLAALHRVHDATDHAAHAIVARQCVRQLTEQPDQVHALVPHFERVLALYRRRGYPPHELLPVLCGLGIAVYYADRVLLERYGQELLSTGSALLGLARARTLQRWLGRKLGLLVALGLAAFAFARRRDNPRVPPFKDALTTFFACVGSLCGVLTICIDPRRALAVAEVLAPVTALGPDHTASLLYEFAKNLGHTVQDHLGDARERWQRLIARLDRAEGIAGVDTLIRERYLYGGLYALGVLECWRDGSAALAIADRLERSGIALYRSSADQLRTVYYANRGDVARYEHYRGRAELHAIKRGSAWQVEVWAPMAAITPCQRLHDVIGMKHAVEQLTRLAVSVDALERGLSRARGTYELLRKRYAAALGELARVEDEEPRFVVGWGRTYGSLARAYNGLGRHAEALATAERAIGQLTPADRTFAAMNLGLELERVYAYIGLGRHAQAAEQLAELAALHAESDNPLTRGALAEAAFRFAIARGDESGARAAYQELELHYLGTSAPSLVARAESFGRELARAFALPVPTPSGDDALEAAAYHSASVGLTVVEHALSTLSPVERRVRALELVLSAARSERGALAMIEGGVPRVCAASHGFRLAPELSAWLVQRTQALSDEHLDATESDDGEAGDPDLFELGRARYRVCALRASDATGRVELCGALLYEEPAIGAATVSPYMLEVIARRLRDPHTVTGA